MIGNKNFELIKAIKESCKCAVDPSKMSVEEFLDLFVYFATDGEYSRREDVPYAQKGFSETICRIDCGMVENEFTSNRDPFAFVNSELAMGKISGVKLYPSGTNFRLKDELS